MCLVKDFSFDPITYVIDITVLLTFTGDYRSNMKVKVLLTFILVKYNCLLK